MATYNVIGAGDNGYNGVYVETGTHDGKPAYQRGGTDHWIYWIELTEWGIGPFPGSNPPIYYNTSSTSTPPETGVGEWGVAAPYVGIKNPAPNVDLVADDTTPPIFSLGSVPSEGDRLVVTLDEPFSPPILPATGLTGFTVFVENFEDTVTRAIESITITGPVVTIFLHAGNYIFAGESVFLDYSGGNVKDSSDNEMEPFYESISNFSALEHTGDDIPPVFGSATVPSSGTYVLVDLDEEESTPIKPASGITGFTVTVEGESRGITSATREPFTGVKLMLASPVYAGETVTVAYSGGNVADDADNMMEAFGAQDATNNSTQISITSFTPLLGPPGTEVTITGKGFTGTSGGGGVTFNGQNATSYTVDSGTQIRAVVPYFSAQAATVRVHNGGTATASAQFEVTRALIITGLEVIAVNNGLHVAWNPFDVGVGFEVFKSETSGEAGESLGELGYTSFFVDTAVLNGVDYFYTVRGYYTSPVTGVRMYGELSDEVGGAQDATGGAELMVPQVELPSGSVVMLFEIGAASQWPARTTDIRFEVQTWNSATEAYGASRVEDLAPPPANAALDTPVWGQGDFSVERSLSCRVRFRARVGGDLTFGDWLEVGAPAAPQDFVAEYTGTPPRIDLFWSEAPRADSYAVYRYNPATGTRGELVGTTTGTYLADDGADLSATNHYLLVAINEFGESAGALAEADMPPAAPTGLRVTNTWPNTSGRTFAGLEWDYDDSVAYYTVYRGDASGGPFTQIGVTEATGFEDSTVAHSPTYYYTVRGNKVRNGASIEGAAAAPVSYYAEPGAPFRLRAALEDEFIRLTWEPGGGAASQRIYRSVDGGDFELLYTAGGSSEIYDDTAGLEPGTLYRYYVVAHNDHGDALAASNIASNQTAPAAPENLHGTISSQAVLLAWDAVDGADSYRVYRSSSAGTDYELVGTTSANAYNNNSHLFDDRTYYYTVTALNESGESEYAEEFAAVMPPLYPWPFLASIHADNYPVLSWGAPANATSYTLYRGANGAPPTLYQSGLTATTYADSSTVAGSVYVYRLYAVGANGTSATYAVLQVQVPPPAPVVSVAIEPKRITLSWAAVPGANYYWVFRATSPDGPFVYQGSQTSPYAQWYWQDGDTYYFKVQGFAPSYVAGLISEVATAVMYPQPPASLRATEVDREAVITWGAARGATSYTVWRGLTQYGPFDTQVGGSITGPILTVTDSTVVPGFDYFFQVRAHNVTGMTPSVGSIAYTSLPDIPTGLTATPNSSPTEFPSVVLHWDAVNDPKPLWYEVRRYSGYGEFHYYWGSYVAAVTNGSGTWTDTEARYGQSYRYSVAPWGNGYNGIYAATETVRMLPSPPSYLDADGYGDFIVLLWQEGMGHDEYELERATTAAGPFELLTTLTDNQFIDDSTLLGTNYFYRVRGRNTTGASGYTNVAGSVTRPEAPTGLVVTVVENVVHLDWTAAPAANHYHIYRSDSQGTAYEFWGGYVAGGPTAYIDTRAEAGHLYYYVVTAGNNAGESDYSNEDWGQLPPPRPNAPTLTMNELHHPVISWGAAYGADSYQVQRATTVDGDYSDVGDAVAGLGYEDTSGAAGLTYYYRVYASNEAGDGLPSVAVKGIMYPAQVTGLEVTVSHNAALLEWDEVVGVTYYEVWRRDGVTGDYRYITTRSRFDTTYTDTFADGQGALYYKVRAVNIATNNAAQQGAFSDPVAVLAYPPAATSLRATNMSDRIRLNWQGETAGGTSFKVERSVGNNSGFAQVATSASATWDDTSLTPGEIYFYRVRATNATGDSTSYSNEAAQRRAPAAPTLDAPVGDVLPVQLTWDSVSGAETYKIFRSAGSGGYNYSSPLGYASGTSFTDTSAQFGHTYYYELRASNSGGDSASSGERMLVMKPLPPTHLTAAAGDGDAIDLAWTAGDGAASYAVFRSDNGAAFAAVSGAGAVTGTEWTDTTAAAGHTYLYYLKSNNSSGYPSEASNQAGLAAATDPPASLTLARDGDDIHLVWSAVTGATVYHVYRSENAGLGYVWQADVSAPTVAWLDEAAALGHHYYYVVTSQNLAGGAPESGYSVERDMLQRPAPPSFLHSFAQNRKNNLQWSESSLADTYRVYRSDVNGVNWQAVRSGLEQASWQDENVAPGSVWYYTVTAWNDAGESDFAYAAAGHQPVAVPSGLRVVVSSHQVVFSWGAVAGASAYRVYRSTPASVHWLKLVDSTELLTYTNSGLQNDTVFYYAVAAIDGYDGHESAMSEPILAVMPPNPPSGLSAVGGFNKVDLAWEASSVATSYELWRAEVTGEEVGTYARLQLDLPLTTTADPTALNAHTYAYYVITINPNGVSVPSVAAQVTLAPNAPSALDGEVVEDTDVALTWNAPFGAEGYRVYRAGVDNEPYPYLDDCEDNEYTDESSVAGATYYYYVTALNAGGESRPSAPFMLIVDRTAPEFESAVVASDGNSVVVTLKEDDSLPVLPASGVTGFALVVAGAERGIAAAARVGGSGAAARQIRLTVASPIYRGQSVTVAYDGGPGNVQDSAANEMATFGAEIVANESGRCVVSSFTPTSGRFGATVTMTGIGFTGATAVRFGGTNAVSFAVVNDTTITAVAPDIAAAAAIVVATPDGDSAPSSSNYTPLAPAAPGAPVGLYHVCNSATDHRLRISAPGVLPEGASSFRLQLWGENGTAHNLQSIATVAAGQVVTSANTYNAGARWFGVQWFAVNAAGEASGSIVRADFRDGGSRTPLVGDLDSYNYSAASGPLPVVPETMPEPDSATATRFSFTAPATLADGATYYQVASLHGAEVAESSIIREGYQPAVNAGEEVTYTPASGSTGPRTIAWRALNAYGAVYGPTSVFALALPPGLPPAPVVSATTETTATVEPLTFADDWDSVVLRYWRVGNPASVMTVAVAPGTLTILSDLVTRQPYQCRYRAVNENGEADGPTTGFTPGGVGLGLPDPPAELTILTLSDAAVTVLMPALPANADTLNLCWKVEGVFTPIRSELSGGVEVVVTGLDPAQGYVLIAQSVNVFGASDGPPLELRTRTTPGETTPPDAPAAPTLKEKAPAFAAILQPAWPTGTTSLVLQRRRIDIAIEWATVHTFTSNIAGAYHDGGVVNGGRYEYRAIARNGIGDSVPSGVLAVSLVGTATPEWTAPGAGNISGLVALLADVTAPQGVRATEPLQVLYHGTPLPGTVLTGTTTARHYKTLWDTALIELQGSVTLALVAYDNLGFASAPAERTFVLNNTLRTATVWWATVVQPAVVAAMAAHEQRIASVRCVGTPLARDAATDPWIQTWFVSPDPGALDDEASPQELAEYLQKFQPLKPGDWARRVTVLGQRADSGAWNTSGPSGRWMMTFSLPYKMSKYATGTDSVPKLRRLSDTATAWFGTGTGECGAKYGRLDTDGIFVTYDLAEAGFGAAVDAAQVDDKIFVVMPPGGDLTAGVWLVDTDTDDIAVYYRPKGENGVATFAEAAGDVAFLFYIDDGVTTIYQRTSDNTRAGFDSLTIDATVTLTAARESVLAYATDAGAVYVASSGGAPSQVFPATGVHNVAIAGMQLDDDGVHEVVDADGVIWRRDGEVWRNAATVAGTTALGQFQGYAESMKGVAGGALSNKLYIQRGENGCYTDVYTLSGATGLLAMERQVETVAAGSGASALMGGVAAEMQERLLIGVAADDGGGYIALLEEAAISATQAFRAYEIELLSYAVTGRVSAVLPTSD